jgi:hypothetical protein
MKLYGGIDLHSNNSVVALLDEEDHVVYRKRLINEVPAAPVPAPLRLSRSSETQAADEPESMSFQSADGRLPLPFPPHTNSTS